MVRFTTLDDWLVWQSNLHPRRMDLGLERVGAVWARLAPEGGRLPCPVITVGGTNGKGSTVAMIEAMALAAGYHCGVYTSPHLCRYNERVRLDGVPVADEALCESFARIDRARGEISLTYFEFGTLAALDRFARARPDLVVLEVGLGGRLDAVNLIDAEVSVVTSIGLDHTDWLGEDLESIAREKAGIFRAGRPAIIGQRDAPETLRAEATRIGALPLQLGRELDHAPTAEGWVWTGPDGQRLALPVPALRGPFQLDNATAAIAALQALREQLPVPVNAIRAGLQRVRLPGRFQVMSGDITWILDVAHNGEAATALAANLRAFACPGRLRAVLAVLADKSPERLVAPLRDLVNDWYLAQSEDARALPVRTLSERLDGLIGAHRRGAFGSVADAIGAALAESMPGDALLILGSFTTVGQALRHPACPA
ncbi:bifunctional tetrahydrofolate synthase/dihydrofolate synthase [Thermochromatium tepidum]|uniref:Dihydrofolate synthase/folylpolyglutamate synthase n=1 Tax=Thermochromatium tepidum ATCC 43061 TaxID=316276 RepID=A0A6I6EET5_THETI|nr:bifunctional tetrahydrofolate synthase/dihydrofolate synthase [Thermochromatium tepidum]QGU32680.1 bifunctional tetrahydrofolate synthase/dihydrofolate synthase [Thermochromatium tepidum ATCC 43061]